MTAEPMYEADLAVLLAAWESALHTVSTLGRQLDADQWNAPTECTGWTCGDLVRHLCSAEATFAGHPQPDHEPDWAAFPHLTTEFGRRNEVGVDARRPMTQPEVCDELDTLVDERLAQLMTLAPMAADTIVPGPFGPAPLEQLLRMRCFDTWTHEQDIRRAAGMAGNLGTAGARISAAQILAALPKVVAKVLAAPPGARVRLEVTGEVGFAHDVAVGEDGRAALAPAVGTPTVSLGTDWETFARLAAGRIDPDGAAVTLTGEPDLAGRLLPALAITP